MEIFKQDQFGPVPVANQVLIFFAITKGYLDDMCRWIRSGNSKRGLYRIRFRKRRKNTQGNIAETGDLDDEQAKENSDLDREL